MLAHSAAASIVPTQRKITLPVQAGLHFYLDASAPSSYPGSGNTWYDLMGNLNPSTIRSAVSFTSNGRASYFTIPGGVGITEYTDRAIASDGNNYPAFIGGHLSAWVYKLGWGGEQEDHIFNFRAGNSNFDLFFDDFDNDLVASVTPDGSFNYVARKAGIAEGDYRNQWTYLSMTWNGNYQGNFTLLELYRNGVKIADFVGGVASSISAKTGIDTGIGGDGRGLSGSTRLQRDIFNGRIALMHFHTEALTATDIQDNFNSMKSRFGL